MLNAKRLRFCCAGAVLWVFSRATEPVAWEKTGILTCMNPLFDSFWRAVAYCMHPRVIALSFLPLILMVLLSFGLGYFFWEAAVASVSAWLQSYELMQAFLGWLDRLGMGGLRSVFGPLLVLVMATPVIVLLCLLLVAVFMTPAMVELVSQRRAAGAATALDYQEAVGLAEQARAERESTERQLRQADNALVLLLGTPDAARLLPATPRDDLMVLQDIAPGTSSELIERRPDILASEHRLKARNADIGAARAAFFPRISLTGSVGSSSAELSGLFDGGSRAWSFAPTLSLPIFAGGRNRANLDLAEVRQDAAVADYEGTIQTAFREVADALAATDTLRREEAARQALAGSSEAAMALAKARYEGGVDDYLRYLDAQRSTFSNQTTLIQISTERQIALVDLFRSLGGGWGQTEPMAGIGAE